MTIKEYLSEQDIEFWYYSSQNTAETDKIGKVSRLLFDIYKNIDWSNSRGQMKIFRDNRYYICLEFHKDFLPTIKTILRKLSNDSYYEDEYFIKYFLDNGNKYYIYKSDIEDYLTLSFDIPTIRFTQISIEELIFHQNKKHVFEIIENNI